MKTVFLTSSPFGPLDNSRYVEGFDPMNSFPENLAERWPDDARCLVISAFPAEPDRCDEMRESMEQDILTSGFPLSCLDIWDDRTDEFSPQSLMSYDVVFLGGGHVPTENAFFQRIDLRESMRSYEGIVIGISAGTMNSANIVYAQPELDGEAVDPSYSRFLYGLGLTELNILPHYQMVKNFTLDGMRLYEDITYADSCGHRFLVLPDGSYVIGENGAEFVWGEAYVLADGVLTEVCRNGECVCAEDIM